MLEKFRAQARPVMGTLSLVLPTTPKELVEQVQREVHFLAGDCERRRESEDILVVASDIEDEPVFPPAVFQVPLQAFGEDPVREVAVGRDAVFLADLDAQRQPEPVNVANRVAMPPLEFAQAGEEIRALFVHQLLVVLFFEKLEGFQRHGGPQSVG